MKIFKKAFVLIFVVGLILGIAPQEAAQAASKPGKPTITLEALENGTAVKVTIQKTSGADGYKIVMKAPGATKYKKIKTLKKNGTTVRTYTVKGLKEGKYYFKVKAYNKSESKTVYSSYSKTKSISLKTSSVTIVDIGTNGTYFSVDQVNAKIKELCKKYPKYTEDEIRSLVATTNMDYIDVKDIYTIFNVNSKKELKSKVEQADQLIIDAAASISAEYSTNFFDDEEEYYYYEPGMKDYKDIIWANDLIMDETLKIHGDYMCDILRTYVDKGITVEELEELGIKARGLDGILAFYKFEIWFYDCNDSVKELAPSHCYDETKVININDERLQGSTGYMLNKFLYCAYENNMLDWRATAYTMEAENREGYVTIDLANELEKNNYIYEKVDALSKK